MTSREELLKAAPEGVTYVYTETVENRDHIGYFWHDGKWKTARLGRPHDRTPEDTWEALVDYEIDGVWAEELSRRFAAQYTMLNQWMLELGIERDFYLHLGEVWEIEDNSTFHITLQQQEDRPRLALEFLKEHFANLSGIIGESTGRCYLHSGITGTQRTFPPPEPQTHTTKGRTGSDKLHIEKGQFQATPETLEERNEERRKIQAEYQRQLDECVEAQPKPTDPWGEATDTRGYPDA